MVKQEYWTIKNMLYQMGPEIDTSEKDLRFEKKKKGADGRYISASQIWYVYIFKVQIGGRLDEIIR